MNPHIHEVNERRHQAFLSEGRKDPFTKEKIKAGDRIVFCAVCKSAFLHSSWEAMRGRHCEQTETLTEFPHTLRLGDVTKLRQEIQDLTQESENKNVKIKAFSTFCCFFFGIIAGIGYLAYDQYQRIQSLQSLNTNKGSQIVSMKQQRDRVDAKIASLSGKITLDNCQNNNNDIKQPTPLEEKVASFEKKLDCLVTERDNFQNERNSRNQRVTEIQNLLTETQKQLESTKQQLQTTQSNLRQTNQNLTQTKKKLQQREQQVTEGSKCVKLIGEINNVIWEGAALNTDAVRLIQKQLKSLGFYQGEIDGTFAQITIKAVKDFQQNCQANLERQ